MAELKILEVKKPWGNFRQFTHNSSSTVKIITVNPGETLSLQNHAKRSEFWRVTRGEGVIEVNGAKHHVQVGDERSIPIGAKHRLKAGPNGIQVLEIATGNFDEEDIVRFEDKYGRAN